MSDCDYCKTRKRQGYEHGYYDAAQEFARLNSAIMKTFVEDNVQNAARLRKAGEDLLDLKIQIGNEKEPK